jgi:hypothetical protein
MIDDVSHPAIAFYVLPKSRTELCLSLNCYQFYHQNRGPLLVKATGFVANDNVERFSKAEVPETAHP